MGRKVNCHSDTCLLQRSEGVSILLYTSFKSGLCANRYIPANPRHERIPARFFPRASSWLALRAVSDWSLVHLISLGNTHDAPQPFGSKSEMRSRAEPRGRFDVAGRCKVGLVGCAVVGKQIVWTVGSHDDSIN